MSTTLSMWLGISFLLLGIIATVLQGWLWRFPMLPDPGGRDPNGKSSAPRSWTNVHRLVGVLFVLIYLVMMWQMVPRLWEYQVELPARTILHAVMGLTIGFLLITKIAIIRWFQHFGKALPQIGALIMLCTLILSFLSVPYALRAQDFGSATTPDGLARVERLVADIDLGVPPATLATADAMSHGREVLTLKCVVCHDLRTILRRPYTPQGWRDVVWRMAEKPQIDRPMFEEDLAPVTAYLIAITPDIQQSVKMKRDSEVERLDTGEPLAEETAPGPPVDAPIEAAGDSPGDAPGDAPVATKVAVVVLDGGEAKGDAKGDAPTTDPVAPADLVAPGVVAPANPLAAEAALAPDTGAVTPPATPIEGPGAAPAVVEPAAVAPPPPKPKKRGIDLDAPGAMARAKAVYVKQCGSCHDLSDTENYGRQTEGAWRALVKRMNTENDAGIKSYDAAIIVAYLTRTQGKTK